MPSNFGLGYALRVTGWWLFCNPITVLASLQGIFQAITLDPTIVSHDAIHWISILNLALIVIIAQIRKGNTLPPPPSKGPQP
jgi:hypothetical protein